jgi:hypothetical protein
MFPQRSVRLICQQRWRGRGTRAWITTDIEVEVWVSVEERNLAIFLELEASWPGGDWEETFRKTHAPDVVVHWPGGRAPTRGIEDHIREAGDFPSAFPDVNIELPHRVLFASGDWTCAITRFTGTMTGPMTAPDGTQIPPTNKSFDVDLCTVARWQNGMIVEEHIFFDLVGFTQQLELA